MNRSPATEETALARAPCLALGVLLAGATGYVVATTGTLPEVVATHFDGNDRPNGWMTRDGYLAFMLAFTIGLPLFVAAAVGWLPRRFPRLTNVPNREHWFAPERRDATLAFLARMGCLLGCLMVLFSAGVHALILDAHTVTPPRLASHWLMWIMAVFLIALTLFAFALFRRFALRRAH